ncbi:hypothetical protein KZJ38_18710 [Paraburkholderia edwinii]|uniref:DUF429 domain-containing protein n=1 Tax=Paraburkholderia edwinii TaxID=2861782 RepID=A0ABX8UHB8_9BURK|nr:hypothetical protein [Paraburkholderia edwinii]QYD68268.1 hypothetical protein KZJ38_18710 [Paraburkholderia edwinii]
MMEPKTKSYRSRSGRLYEILPAYVIAFNDDDGGVCIWTDATEFGRAIVCHLSPVDAVIDAKQSYRAKHKCWAVPASQLPPETFRDPDGRGMLAKVHLAWPAIGGKLLQHPRGTFATYRRAMYHVMEPPLILAFDDIVLGELDRLYQAAGLFAWRETYALLHDWQPERIHRAADIALKSIKTTGGKLDQCMQVALFDPEAERWHFVPLPEAHSQFYDAMR